MVLWGRLRLVVSHPRGGLDGWVHSNLHAQASQQCDLRPQKLLQVPPVFSELFGVVFAASDLVVAHLLASVLLANQGMGGWGCRVLPVSEGQDAASWAVEEWK